ncbi:MAG: gamma-glutamyltransferase [Pseudomonadota bacterium]
MRIFGVIGFCVLSLSVACERNGRVPADAAAQREAASSAGETAQNQWFISAANPYAVAAGAQILEQGGSAVDAAIATQVVLTLVEPQSSGLGGGAFMLHYDPATKLLESYDGREVAPASATPDRFLDDNGDPMDFYEAVTSGLSVGVPGVVRMMEQAHQDHGVLEWSALFQEGERLATDGFAMPERLHGALAWLPRMKATPAARAYFYGEDEEPHPVGHILKNPEFAETLRAISDGGADAFYAGPIAKAIVEAVNAGPNPGGMTLDDIAAYQPTKRVPVCGPYRTYTVCSMGPPSSGGVTVLQILALLSRFDLSASEANSADALHLIFEASKLAYADRNQYLADNETLEKAGGLSSADVIQGLLNKDYLAARADLIDADAAALGVKAGDPAPFIDAAGQTNWERLGADASPEPPSTSHFSIVDGAGRVVSMTSSVEFIFGSHKMAAGMILNNQLTDFSFLPERDGVPVANAVGSGKRPRSSMSPVIVFDEEGDVWAALGSPGGPAIIGFVAKTLVGMIDWGLSTQDAIDLGNVVYPRGKPMLEEGKFDPDIVANLEARGHDIVQRELTSGVHGFRVSTDGAIDGGADPRREGEWRVGAVGASAQ